MRALYFEFLQETNSFNPMNGTVKDFQNYKFCEGTGVLQIDPQVRYKTTGILQAAEDFGIELIPIISLWSQSTGPVEGEIIELLLEKIRTTYAQVGPVDMVLSALHGATQDTRDMPYDDTCGSIVEAVRQMIGPDVIFASSFDLHGNITPRILKNLDACAGYQTYPHQDAHEAMYRAAKLAVMKLRKRDAFTSAAVRVPMMVPASGYTSQDGLFRDIMEIGHQAVRDGLLLDFSIFQMQPWLDAGDPGSTVLAISKDPQNAKKYAEIMAEKLFAARDSFWPSLMTVDEVIDRAAANQQPGPVVLCNSGDSPGAGAVGDSVAVLNRLLERKDAIRFATLVLDRQAVRKAFEVGIGNTAEFTFGAAVTPLGQPPVVEQAKVRSLHEGYFHQEGPINAGMLQYMGIAAVISIGTYDVPLCEYPANTGDPQCFRHFGIEPKLYDLVEVKANTSFRLPYSKFSAEICVADVPGCVGTSNLKSLNFRHIGPDFYPFSHLDGYETGEAIFYP